jgi:2-isopropylmalate synthase
MRERFGYHVKSISDHEHRELSANEVHDIFVRDFVEVRDKLTIETAEYEEQSDGVMRATLGIIYKGEKKRIEAMGNGRLNCTALAIKEIIGQDYLLDSYAEHALEEASTAKAASYISVTQKGKTYWGAGIHTDIMTSSLNALISAVNKMLSAK